MKVKNLNLVEKYIEKIVIALAILFGCAVIWFKFLGEPYAVALKDGSAPIAPANIEDEIIGVAEKLMDEIQKTKIPQDISIPEIIDISQNVDNELRKNIAPNDYRIAIGQPGIDLDIVGNPGEILDEQWLVPDPPAPTKLASVKGYGVLAEPAKAEKIGEFVALIGSQLPRDFRWVSVSGSFNLADWRSILEAEPTDPNLLRIPEQIWRDKIAISDVVLERQEWDVQKDDWGEIQELPALPNNHLGYRQPPATWPAELAMSTMQWIRENRRDITKPSFPHLKRGVWWRPDIDPDSLDAQQKQQFEQLTLQIQEIKQQIGELQLKAADGNAKPAGAAAQPLPMDGPGGNNAARAGAVAARRPAGRGGRAVATAADGLAALREQLDLLIRQQETLIGVVEESDLLGGDLDALAEDADEASAGTQLGAVPTNVTIWAHDISVRPGRSYRYRLRVHVINPLFRDRRVPASQQKKYYDKLSISSLASEWTSYVTIDPSTQFFLVDAHKQKNTAQIEIFTIFNGRVVYRDFSPSPGDLIGGPVQLSDENFQRNVNLEIGAALVDVQFDVPSHGGLSSTTHRIICLDEATGQLFERTVQADRQNPRRLQLKLESERRKVASNR